MFASRVISFLWGGKVFPFTYLIYSVILNFCLCIHLSILILFYFYLCSIYILTHPFLNTSNTQHIEIEAVNLNKSILWISNLIFFHWSVSDTMSPRWPMTFPCFIDNAVVRMDPNCGLIYKYSNPFTKPIIMIIIMIIIISSSSSRTPFRLLTPAFVESYSQEFKWQQLSSSLQNSSQHSVRSQYTVVWIVSTHPLISRSSSPCINPLVITPKATITTGITITFVWHSLFSSLARSRYLSFFSLS